MINKPLILLDLAKSNNNKNGLVQQVITYVRDGKTITRKQWVRSEFADHAKKNEEQRKKTMLKQAEKEKKKHEKDIEEGNIKQALKDMSDRRKMEIKRNSDKPKTEVEKEMYNKRKEIHKRSKDEELQRHEEDMKRKNQQERDKKNSKDKRGAYGQEDQTRAETKREVDNLVSLHRGNSSSDNSK